MTSESDEAVLVLLDFVFDLVLRLELSLSLGVLLGGLVGEVVHFDLLLDPVFEVADHLVGFVDILKFSGCHFIINLNYE